MHFILSLVLGVSEQSDTMKEESAILTYACMLQDQMEVKVVINPRAEGQQLVPQASPELAQSKKQKSEEERVCTSVTGSQQQHGC